MTTLAYDPNKAANVALVLQSGKIIPFSELENFVAGMMMTPTALLSTDCQLIVADSAPTPIIEAIYNNPACHDFIVYLKSLLPTADRLSAQTTELRTEVTRHDQAANALSANQTRSFSSEKLVLKKTIAIGHLNLLAATLNQIWGAYASAKAMWDTVPEQVDDILTKRAALMANT